MRASRLVSTVLLLQARGRMTAGQLAAEQEVSLRTVYRDIEALQEAGIPVYGDAGHRGGYQLLDGYRTRLTGLTPDEARALSLAGLPGPAGELGLGAMLAAAQLKVRAALPAGLADEAGKIQARFHLDAPGWYTRPDEVPFLTAVAGAVWRNRVLLMRYRRWQAPTDVDRRLRPYGLVLKAGRWYLIAAGDGGAARDGSPGVARADVPPRTYRVDQILALDVLDEEFGFPDDFDLARYWQAATAGFLDRLHTAEAVIRLAPDAVSRLSGPAARAVKETGAAEPGGWIRATLPIESADHACAQFLALGADIEVLGPPPLRARIASTARTIAARYHPADRERG